MADPTRFLQKSAEDIVREHPELIGILHNAKRLTYGITQMNTKNFPNSDWDRCMVFAMYWLMQGLDPDAQDGEVRLHRQRIADFWSDVQDKAQAEAAFNMQGKAAASATSAADRKANTAALLADLGL